MSDNETTFEVKGLDKILKALKTPASVRVGILGAKVQRQGGGLTNAQIGAQHEFGTTRLPVRSFLRLPLTTLLGKRLEESGALDKAALAKVIAEGSPREWLERVGVLAEGLVIEAFATSGFGTWIQSNMTRKKVQQTLVESGQLRDSITHEVKVAS